ncbi:MAG: acyl carrier protein [Paracoccaceae bacterium]
MDQSEIFTFLEDDLGIETDDIEASTLLFSSGIIDSFALVTLMSFIESTAEFRIGPADVNLDNFDSVERICAFVEKSKT